MRNRLDKKKRNPKVKGGKRKVFCRPSPAVFSSRDRNRRRRSSGRCRVDDVVVEDGGVGDAEGTTLAGPGGMGRGKEGFCTDLIFIFVMGFIRSSIVGLS